MTVMGDPIHFDSCREREVTFAGLVPHSLQVSGGLSGRSSGDIRERGKVTDTEGIDGIVYMISHPMATPVRM